MNMKMNIKNYIVKGSLCCVACVALVLTGCMDLDPKDSMGDNLVWSKPDNFQLFANQFYGWTRDMASAPAASTPTAKAPTPFLPPTTTSPRSTSASTTPTCC